MTKKTYNEILKNIIKNNDPKDAMYIIEHFNMNLVDEQPHMLKASQVAEGIIYPYFIKFAAKNDVFSNTSNGGRFCQPVDKTRWLQR